MIAAEAEERSPSVILLASLFALVLLALGAAEPAGPQGQVEARCELLPTKTSVLLCEPLVVDLRLTNASQRDIYVPVSASMGPGDIRVTYSGPDGTTGLCMPALHEFTEDKRRALAPGESFYSRLFLVLSDAQDSRRQARFVFDQAGTYRIRAGIHVYGAPRGGRALRIESEPIEVTAVEPKGEDREALLLYRVGLRGVSLGLMAGAGMPDLGVKEKEDLKRLMAEYPESIYAQYVVYRQARFTLGHYGPILALPEPHVPQPLRTHLERMEALVRSHPDFPALDEVMLGLAQCYEVAGSYEGAWHREESEKLRAQIVSRFPDGAVAALLRSGERIRVRSITAVVKE